MSEIRKLLMKALYDDVTNYGQKTLIQRHQDMSRRIAAAIKIVDDEEWEGGL